MTETTRKHLIVLTYGKKFNLIWQIIDTKTGEVIVDNLKSMKEAHDAKDEQNL